MPTLQVREAIYRLAIDTAKAARIFTLPQLAQHPKLRDLSQPVKRASECLRAHAGDFVKSEGAYGEPYRFRLSPEARKRLGVTSKAIHGKSLKSDHWLSLGDVYLALRFRGGVQAWESEPAHSAGFDIFLAYQGLPIVAEVQRTPLTEKQWAAKLEPRQKWLETPEEIAEASWQPPGRAYQPIPLLVNLTGQDVTLPPGWIHARTTEEVPTILMRYKMKMSRPS